jgi:WD40 repeat protein
MAVRSPLTLATGWRFALDGSVQDLIWSPDGRWLAVAAVEGPIAVLDGDTGSVRRRYRGHDGGTLCLTWSPDGRRLASGGQDGCVRVWEPEADAEALTLAAGDAWVGAVRFTPHADLLIGAAGKDLRAWNPAGTLLHAVKPHTSTITDLDWHPQRPLLASAAFGQVHLWDFRAQPQPDEEMLPRAASLLRLRWSPDGRYLACGCQDCSLVVWTWPDAEDYEMRGYGAKLTTLAWDSASRRLATGDIESVAVWDFAAGPPVDCEPLILEGLLDAVSDLAFQPQGLLLAAGDRGGVVTIWQMDARRPWPVGSGLLRDGCRRLVWHLQGQRLTAGGADGVITAFDLQR